MMTTLEVSGQDAYFVLVGKHRSEGKSFAEAKELAIQTIVAANGAAVKVTIDLTKIQSYLADA